MIGLTGKETLRIGRVGVAELTALVTIYTTTDVFLSYPARVAKEGASAAFIVPLISGLVVLAGFFVIHLSMRSFSQESFLDVVKRLLSSYVSVPLGLIFMIVFFVQTALVMREFTETVVTTVLPRSPAPVIALLFLAVVYYYAYMGLEGLTRMAILLAGVLFIGLLLLLILPFTWFDFHLLQPVWGRGLGNILHYGATNSSMFMNVLLLMILYPAVRNQQQFMRVGVISITLTAVIMSSVLVVFLITFPEAPNGQVPFPMYQLARLIYVGRFFQRMEAIFVFLWTAAAVLKMGLGLWMTAFLFASVFRMPIYRPILPAIAGLLFIVSFLPPDFPTVQAISERLFEPFGWIFVLAMPVIIALVLGGINHYQTLGKKGGQV